MNRHDRRAEEKQARKIMERVKKGLAVFLMENGPPPDRERWIVAAGINPKGLDIRLLSRSGIRASLDRYMPENADDAAYIRGSIKQLEEAPAGSVLTMMLAPGGWGSITWVKIVPLSGREWATKPEGWASIPLVHSPGVHAEVNARGGWS